MSDSANFDAICLPARSLLVLGLAALTVACAGRTEVADSRPIEHQLMAEIAFQRGQHRVAIEEYLQLAEDTGSADYARRTTELAYGFGYDVPALAAAELWVDLAPDEKLANAYLGRMYLRRNDRDSAFRHLDISLGPLAAREERDYIALSVDLADSVPPVRALDVYQRFQESALTQPGFWGGLATLSASANDYPRAVDAARRTVQLAPDWVAARVWLAQFLLFNGDTTSAFEQMAFVLEMNPGLEMELEFLQLLALAEAEQDARDRLERLEERYPRDPDLLRTRALLLLNWGDLEAAQADFTQLLAEAYFVNEAFWYLGEIAYRQEKYLEAIRYLERITAGTWVVRSRTAISQAYLALGDGETALAVQRELAADYPKQYLATLQPQAEILAEMDRIAEALELADIVIANKPWDERHRLFKGVLLEQAGELDGAIDAFQEAIELAPDSAVALNALGYSMSNNGDDYDDAQRYIEQALAIEPDNGAYMDSLGWVLYRRGEREAALTWLEQAYEQLPDPEIAAHLGEVLWELGREDRAIDIWAEALTSFPDERVLLETTERYLQ